MCETIYYYTSIQCVPEFGDFYRIDNTFDRLPPRTEQKDSLLHNPPEINRLQNAIERRKGGSVKGRGAGCSFSYCSLKYSLRAPLQEFVDADYGRSALRSDRCSPYLGKREGSPSTLGKGGYILDYCERERSRVRRVIIYRRSPVKIVPNARLGRNATFRHSLFNSCDRTARMKVANEKYVPPPPIGERVRFSQPPHECPEFPRKNLAIHGLVVRVQAVKRESHAAKVSHSRPLPYVLAGERLPAIGRVLLASNLPHETPAAKHDSEPV